jgi:hypothetical protein
MVARYVLPHFSFWNDILVSPDDDYVPGSDWYEDSCNPVTGYREEVVPF